MNLTSLLVMIVVLNLVRVGSFTAVKTWLVFLWLRHLVGQDLSLRSSAMNRDNSLLNAGNDVHAYAVL